MSKRNFVLAILVVAIAGGCAPRVAPLKGAPAPSRVLPEIPLAGVHRRIVFRWSYEENSLFAHGEGAIRAAAPDSARVDFFFMGGVAAGHAILIGDSLRGTSADQVRRVLPPPAMIWAALGRLVLPALPDTVITADGDILEANIGRPATWRVSIKGDRLMQLARLNGGRIAEVVTRDGGGRLLYEVPGRRRLWLGIVRDEEVPAFDAAIWTR